MAEFMLWRLWSAGEGWGLVRFRPDCVVVGTYVLGGVRFGHLVEKGRLITWADLTAHEALGSGVRERRSTRVLQEGNREKGA